MSGQRDQKLRAGRGIIALVGIVFVFSLGVALGRFRRASGPEVAGELSHAWGETWTCSMHPQIQQDAPGQCPLCGMDLIPIEHDHSAAALAPRQLSLSPAARQLAEVATAVVLRRAAEVEIPLAGKIRVDETRRAQISAYVPGRIDRMHVAATGEYVRAGDPLVLLYSPDLFTAHTELLEALKQVRARENGAAAYGTPAMESNLEAVRRKLRLWGLSDRQVGELERTAQAQAHITIPAPLSGTILEKPVQEGQYVQTGATLYTLADLSTVWAVLEAYESDLPWLRPGQSVTLRTPALPGDVFAGHITFIAPVMNAITRTVRVRVPLPNSEGGLKPEMLIHARVKGRLDRDGGLRPVDLAGLWRCPEHPAVLSEIPGTCDVCGSPLEEAYAHGHAGGEADDGGDPLVIPASAPLITGQRAVVYVEARAGLYEGREVELGPRAGDVYVVRAGLREGERIVIEGNFKIDSAMQIQARPSMMSMSGGALTEERDMRSAEPGEVVVLERVPPAFTDALRPLYEGYFAVQRALSRDDLAATQRSAGDLARALKEIEVPRRATELSAVWSRAATALRDIAERMAGATEIASARAAFEPLSLWVIWLVRSFGIASTEPILRYHCPMAFDWRGADWLQTTSGTENPYFGTAMFTCGDEVEVMWPGDGSHEKP